jgi:biopolymer transport protein ExbB
MRFMRRHALPAGLAVLALHLACAAGLWAQDGSPKPDAPEVSYSFFHVYIYGGGGIGFLFLLPIEILSIATVAAIIEHFVSLQRDKLVPPQLIVELETLIEEKKYDQAISLCQASRNYLTNIVAAAIARLADGYDSMRAAALTACDEENLKLIHKISWLSLFGSLGPMMGLFGTVVGMVMAFTQIAQEVGTPSPQDLAQGIFTALVTTVWGLLVAMPALGFFYVFKMRVQRLSIELGNVALEIVDRFKPAGAIAAK